jgi:hypothetical protein
MEKNVLDRFQQIIRWFLLFSVLTGIFFSNGEGIHLLPFPVSSESNEQSTYSFEAKSRKSYTLSARNQNNRSLLLKAKFQKDNNKDFSCGALSANEFSHVKIVRFSLKQNHKEEKLFYTSSFLIFPSDRAPPVI